MARRVFTILALVCTLAAPAFGAETTRLSGPVDSTWVAKANAAIARGDRVVEITSDVGGMIPYAIEISSAFKAAGIKVRCVGVCFSAAAEILVESGGCIIGRNARVVFHRPVPVVALDTVAFARGLEQVRQDWHGRMAAAGVPDDLVFNIEQGRDGQYEPNAYALKRIGCTVE